jgi:glucose/arabinose dehydrogenase
MPPTAPRARRRLRVALGPALAAAALLALGLARPASGAALRDPVTYGSAPASARAPVTDATPTPASPTSAVIKLVKVAGNLSSPVFATAAPDGSGRLFIVEQTGRIRILKNGQVLPTPFLDISASVSKGGEQGLLGLAFHSHFATNRRYYVNYTNTAGDTRVREYRASAANPDRTESGSGRAILAIDQPYANHNGGMLAWGPDGALYIGTGDGGSAGDPGNRAQSTSSLLGKILRINVNGSTSTRNYLVPSSNPYVGRAGLDEIWQRGLRNPWRFSFDRLTGSLWIGDVGQARYEEIDRATVSSSGAGRGANWGWRVMEGSHCYNPPSGCSTSGKRLPVVEYSHSSTGRCAVTGGYVYRGSAIPALAGGYVFGDYCTGEIWVIAHNAPTPTVPTRRLDTNLRISSFGQDAAGELYVCDLNGGVYRIAAG